MRLEIFRSENSPKWARGERSKEIVCLDSSEWTNMYFWHLGSGILDWMDNTGQ